MHIYIYIHIYILYICIYIYIYTYIYMYHSTDIHKNRSKILIWSKFLHSLSYPENGDVRCKIDALKKVIQMILNGEKMQGLLMTVIRFVMPLHDHTIKKLLLVFWEVVPKYSQDGKMLQEMILVCDAYRKVWVFLNGLSKGMENWSYTISPIRIPFFSPVIWLLTWIVYILYLYSNSMMCHLSSRLARYDSRL